MTFLESDGIQLSYQDTGGAGRPVVLIHGWPLQGASWAEQVPALTDAGHRVITYDRRGFGSSDKPDDGYDYDTLAADLAGLLDGLDLTDVTLVGFSMGGGEVARYLGRYGDARVHSAVFASAVPPFLLQTDDNPGGGMSEDDVQEMEAGASNDPKGSLAGFARDLYTADGDLLVSEERVQQAIEMAEPARAEAVLGCIDAFARTDFRGDLAEISVPCLVLHGDSDAIVPLEVSGRRTDEALSDSTLVVLEGAPHGCNVSHAEEFNRALLDFLER